MSMVKGFPLRRIVSTHKAYMQGVKGIRHTDSVIVVLECGHAGLVFGSSLQTANKQCPLCAVPKPPLPQKADESSSLERQLELTQKLNAELQRKLELQKQLADAELERLTRPDVAVAGDGGR